MVMGGRDWCYCNGELVLGDTMLALFAQDILKSNPDEK